MTIHRVLLFLLTLAVFPFYLQPARLLAQNTEPDVVQVEGITTKLILVYSEAGLDEPLIFQSLDDLSSSQNIELETGNQSTMAFVILDAESTGVIYGGESGMLYGVVVLDIYEDALVRIDGDTHKQGHILDTKHCWGKVVEVVSWEAVRPIIKEVLTNGTEESYKGVKKKTWTLVNGDTVTYTHGDEGKILISNAWVNE